jgi:hypothetical protein
LCANQPHRGVLTLNNKKTGDMLIGMVIAMATGTAIQIAADLKRT